METGDRGNGGCIRRSSEALKVGGLTPASPSTTSGVDCPSCLGTEKSRGDDFKTLVLELLRESVIQFPPEDSAFKKHGTLYVPACQPFDIVPYFSVKQ